MFTTRWFPSPQQIQLSMIIAPRRVELQPPLMLIGYCSSHPEGFFFFFFFFLSLYSLLLFSTPQPPLFLPPASEIDDSTCLIVFVVH